MAARRPGLFGFAVAVAVLCLQGFCSLLRVANAGCRPFPAFAGVQQTLHWQPKVASRVSDITEIMVTCPSVGARTRMVVDKDPTVDTVVTQARTALGFDQSFLNDSDFKVYLKSDESTPISGKMGDHGLVPWGPEGMELHLYFDPPLN